MKKILFVIESLSGGGAEKVLTTLVKHLPREQYDVTVLAVTATGVYVDEIKKYCRFQYMLPDYKTLTNPIAKLRYRLDYRWIYSEPVEQVYRRYIKEKYDVEIAFVEGFATKLVAASTNPDSKKICWLHIDMEQNPYADAYYATTEEQRMAYQKYQNIIGVSNSVKVAFERKFSLPNCVQVIYNPVDKEEIRTKALEKCVDSCSELKIISIGRLEEQKGYDRLIRALAQMKESTISYVLWILGEGTQHETLERMIETYGLQERVFLKGFCKNPYSWIQAADVFLCCSRAEGYSLVIAEAMILGKPILSVDCSGPNELLDYGKYGVLVPNTDTDLKNMLSDLFNGKIDLGEYAARSVERQPFFELSAVMRQVEGLLES